MAADSHAFPTDTSHGVAKLPPHRKLKISLREAVLLGGPEPVAAPVRGPDHGLDERVWQLERALHRHRNSDELHRWQLDAGAALARAFVPALVAAALRLDLEIAERTGARLLLGLEVADELLDLPWETLCLGPGEPLALHPRVAFYRAGRGPVGAQPPQVPGPLRILVAIGSPEVQNARGELLDMEAELARILDGVEPARRAGRPAYVRILENGTVRAIREALEAERYHVLHLSCHAGPGVLLLEDETGGEDHVDAGRLCSEALPAGRGLLVVFLAGCSTALEGEGERALPGLARSLLTNGVPAVVAMRASVGDAYATAFGAAFYSSLATAGEPRAFEAFVGALQGLETARVRGEAPWPSAEWSIPVLFLRDDDAAAAVTPLYDPAAELEKIAEPQTVRLAAGMLVRRVGEFVGRRSDQRRILSALRENEVGGVLVRGLGGVGKSTLSAQLAQKLGTEGWLVVSLFGEVCPEDILEEVGQGLLTLAKAKGLPEDHALRDLSREVRRHDLEPLDRFAQLADAVLQQLPLLLVLDNFEDNLTPIEASMPVFRNEQLAAFLRAWLEHAGRTRLLLTCRYPLGLEGIAADRLRDHHLCPLSFAETRKLMWRLPALEFLARPKQERVWAAVGGHPRALEYLDALLRGGEARFEDVAQRLESGLMAKGVADPRAWLTTRGVDFDAALAETVTLAVDDVLLDGLLERLRPVPLAERLLLGAAVYRVAVEETALVWQAGEVPGLPRDLEPDPMPEVAVPESFEQARATLEELGLLAPVELAEGGRRFTVHRWTATRLAERAASEDLEEAHRRAARWWRWRVLKISHELEDFLEARRHHYQAGELAEATLVTEWVCLQLDTWGAYRREEQLIHELLRWLPERSEKTAASYHHLGLIAQKRGAHEQALDWHRQSLLINEGLGNRAGMAAAYHELGNVAYFRGAYDQALAWYRKALQINGEVGNYAGMAASYHQLGIVAAESGDHDQAIEWYRKALQIDEELGDRAGMAKSYHQLGTVAYRRATYDAALDWYRKALHINEDLGNRAGVATSYHQLGIVAQDRGDYDQALDWYRKTLHIEEELGNSAGVASSISQIGVLFTIRGEPAEAVALNLRSLRLRLQIQSPEVRIDLHWLRRQREQLGDERFRAILSEHLDPDSLTTVWEMIESLPPDAQE